MKTRTLDQKRKPRVLRKPRAAQGQLRNLSLHAREKLHSWFRENGGTVPYKEIARRLHSEFDVHASMTALSDYYRDKESEIKSLTTTATTSLVENSSEAPQIIEIRIAVPPGLRVNVVTAEGARQ